MMITQLISTALPLAVQILNGEIRSPTAPLVYQILAPDKKILLETTSIARRKKNDVCDFGELRFQKIVKYSYLENNISERCEKQEPPKDEDRCLKYQYTKTFDKDYDRQMDIVTVIEKKSGQTVEKYLSLFGHIEKKLIFNHDCKESDSENCKQEIEYTYDDNNRIRSYIWTRKINGKSQRSLTHFTWADNQIKFIITRYPDVGLFGFDMNELLLAKNNRSAIRHLRISNEQLVEAAATTVEHDEKTRSITFSTEFSSENCTKVIYRYE